MNALCQSNTFQVRTIASIILSIDQRTNLPEIKMDKNLILASTRDIFFFILRCIKNVSLR